MTGIKDKKEFLASTKLEDDLRDAFQRREAELSEAFGFRTNAS